MRQKTLPRPRPGSISRAAASSCLSWSWKTRLHLQARSPHHHPGTDRPADRVPDGNGALIAGQKLDGYRGASLCAGSRAAPPAPGFLRRGAGRGELSSPGERALTQQCPACRRRRRSRTGSLCADTVRRCWTLGLDISGLGAHQALRDGHFALTTKKRLPEKFGQT